MSTGTVNSFSSFTRYLLCDHDGGPPPLLRQGALLIGEADWTGNGREDAEGKVALGAWTYTRPQDDQRETDLTGAPLRRKAWGAYALVQQPLGSKVTTFLRGGISDGWTTPFSGSLQAGVLVDGAIPGRPDSVFSAGFHAGFLARGWRANLADAGQPQRATELGWEVTLEDKVLPWLKIQPDLQYIRDPAIAPRQDAIVAVLRLTLLPPGQD